jgi:D-3-phosphoglycerate dehydrogenase
MEALPTGPMLYVQNNDVPGVIGMLGVTLGENGVNISRMTVGEEQEQGRNVNIILLNTDTLISKELLEKIQKLKNIHQAMVLELPVIH